MNSGDFRSCGVSGAEWRLISSPKQNRSFPLKRIMETIKLTLAATLAAVSALVSIKAAEAVLSPRAAAKVPRVVASVGHAGHTTATASRSVVGSPRAPSTLPDAGTSATRSGAVAQCKTAAKGQCHMPRCS